MLVLQIIYIYILSLLKGGLNDECNMNVSADIHYIYSSRYLYYHSLLGFTSSLGSHCWVFDTKHKKHDSQV